MPCGAYRLPGAGRDGVLLRRGHTLRRVIHRAGEPVVVDVWGTRAGIRIRAEAGGREAAGDARDAAVSALERMRFALGVDHDLSEFHARFRRDPLVGPAIRTRPWLRPRRRPEPFEALAWAICEQLIETGRAVAIQRRLVRRFGRASPCGKLRDVPAPELLAGRAPPELEACGLAGKRAIAMIRCAREVASGRAVLTDSHEPAWRRLRAIPNIGSWTLEKLAFEGQGRDDQLPAGDLAYVKLVGRLAGLGRRATEDEVREFFEPYAPFSGLAGIYALSSTA